MPYRVELEIQTGISKLEILDLMHYAWEKGVRKARGAREALLKVTGVEMHAVLLPVCLRDPRYVSVA